MYLQTHVCFFRFHPNSRKDCLTNSAADLGSNSAAVAVANAGHAKAKDGVGGAHRRTGAGEDQLENCSESLINFTDFSLENLYLLEESPPIS